MKKSQLKEIIKEVYHEGPDSQDLGRFEEIMEEMKDLAQEALSIAKDGGEGDRAKAYWFAHIMGAIDKENSGYMGGSMIDMASSLESMQEGGEEEDEDENEDDEEDEDENEDDEDMGEPTRNDRPDSLKEIILKALKG